MAEATKTANARAAAAKPVTDNGAAAGAVKEKKVETKAERFKRLVNLRVPKAVKVLGHIANLGLRAQYEYTPEQAAIVIKHLQDGVDHVKRRFAEQTKTEQPTTIL